MFSEWIRRKGFWLIDYVKGSKIRRHFEDIESIMENVDSSASKQSQRNYLDRILHYSKKEVPFYKTNACGDDLSSFPIIDKNIIKANYNDFQSREYQEKKVHELHTSGSTGTPFIVRQDQNKRNRVYAEMTYFWGKAGFEIGMKYVFFRVWTNINRKRRLDAWARNVVMHDIIRLDDLSLEAVRHMLKHDKRIKMLLSYASTFDNLAAYLYRMEDTPEMFSVNAILSGSEVLKETTREKLKSVFGCNVVSAYSNQENGTLAQECIENEEFHLNTASYFFEFLKMDEDVPAEPSEPARVVVTDLFNHAMPLIRYDTGDLALQKEECNCSWKTRSVKSILGRVMDCIYDTEGRAISPVTVTNYMWPFDKLLQYQFVQEDRRKYTLRLNGAKGFYSDSEFISLFRELLGQDADICIEHIGEIPVLASGKRKHVMNNYTIEARDRDK